MRSLSLMIFGALALSGQITYRGNFNSAANAATDVSIAAPAIAITAGDLVIVKVGRFNAAGAAVTSITCGADSLTQAVTADDAAAIGQMDLWYKSNASSNAAAVCTANFSVTAQYRLITVKSFGGIALLSALDKTSCNTAGCSGSTDDAANRTAQNVATSVADELIDYASYNAGTHNWSAASSFVLRSATTAADHIDADRIVASTGSYPGGNVATITSTADNRHISVLATFKIVGSPVSSVRKRAVVTQ